MAKKSKPKLRPSVMVVFPVIFERDIHELREKDTDQVSIFFIFNGFPLLSRFLACSFYEKVLSSFDEFEFFFKILFRKKAGLNTIFEWNCQELIPKCSLPLVRFLT